MSVIPALLWIGGRQTWEDYKNLQTSQLGMRKITRNLVSNKWEGKDQMTSTHALWHTYVLIPTCTPTCMYTHMHTFISHVSITQ